MWTFWFVTALAFFVAALICMVGILLFGGTGFVHWLLTGSWPTDTMGALTDHLPSAVANWGMIATLVTVLGSKAAVAFLVKLAIGLVGISKNSDC